MAKNKKKKPSSTAVAKNQALNAMLYHNRLGVQYNKGVSEGYSLACLIMFWVLHVEHGFGKKRLARMMKQINNFCFDYIAIGPDGTKACDREGFQGLSIQDIIDGLASECGIYIDKETGVFDVEGIEFIRVAEDKGGCKVDYTEAEKAGADNA